MTRMWTIVAVAACTLLPASLAAQEAPRSRPRTRARAQQAPGPFGVFSFSDSRGRIGVVVKAEADAADDKVGARIEAVTPSGPAERAGIKVGDIITRFNGTALGGVRAEEEEESGPGMKLVELARALEPGDTVQVDYRRGTENRKATIVAEDLGWARAEAPGQWREMTEMLAPKMHMGPGEFSFTLGGSAWGGIEMVKLNPELGDYFGTREGVLVVSAPDDSSLALKGGDVILSIGGRKPTSPMHAMRILRSYEEGETVAIDVQRKQKRVTLSWKVPDEESRIHRMLPRMREEPSRFRVAPRMPLLEIRRDRTPLRSLRSI